MMRLFITKSPSVAINIIKALGGHFRCYDNYFESVTDIVSCCVDLEATRQASEPQTPAGKAGSPLAASWVTKESLVRHGISFNSLLTRTDIKMVVHCGVPDHQGQSQINAMLLEDAGQRVLTKCIQMNSTSSRAVRKTIRSL